jgi:hypothetical protein
MDDWPVKYLGWGAWKDLKLTLEKYGYSVKMRSGKKQYAFPAPETEEAVVRIQWLDEDGKEYYWAEATKHTHFVAMKKVDGVWLVFCNTRGWFSAHSIEGNAYLEDGFVTSYYEIEGGRGGEEKGT